MSFDNRGNVPVPPNAPVYTVYPGVHQGNMNYGFHPQAPPPRYEDVINGVPTHPTSPPQPPPRTQEVTEPVGVILVTPAPSYSTMQTRVWAIFAIILVICFVVPFLRF